VSFENSSLRIVSVPKCARFYYDHKTKTIDSVLSFLNSYLLKNLHYTFEIIRQNYPLGFKTFCKKLTNRKRLNTFHASPEIYEYNNNNLMHPLIMGLLC